MSSIEPTPSAPAQRSTDEPVVWFGLPDAPPPPVRRRFQWWWPTALALVLFGTMGGLQWMDQSRPAKPSDSGLAAGAATATSTVEPTPLAQKAPFSSLEQLLDAQETALLAGDRATWLAQVDTASTGLTPQYADLYKTLRALDVGRWRHTAIDDGHLERDRAGTYAVQLTYCLGGSECNTADHPVRVQLSYKVSAHDGRLWLAAAPRPVSPALEAAAPFWLTRVAVKAGLRTIVAVPTAMAASLNSMSAMAETAAAKVDRFRDAPMPWRYMIFVGSRSDFKRWYGGPVDDHNLIGLAHPLTESFIDVTIDKSAAYAFNFRAILQHEMGHVATLQGRFNQVVEAPTWVLEGIAEYVAWDGQSKSTFYRMYDIRNFLRHHKITGIDSAKFDGTVGEESAAYGLAYLEISCIAAKYGEAQMLTFVRAQIHQDMSVDVAAQQILGVAWKAIDSGCVGYIKSAAS